MLMSLAANNFPMSRFSVVTSAWVKSQVQLIEANIVLIGWIETSKHISQEIGIEFLDDRR